MGAIAEQAGKGAGLTDRQTRLVDSIAIAFDDHAAMPTGTELALLAGYGDAAGLGAAIRSEAVQIELKARRSAKIRATLAQKALATMEGLLDAKVPASVRFGAAKWLLEQAGHTNTQDDAKDKPLNEMSEAELLAFMAKAEQVVSAGGSAPIITVTP